MNIGCEVLTPYGWGILRGQPSTDKYVIELDAWQLSGKSVPLLYANKAAVLRSSLYDIGSCLLTKYGSGILFQYRRETDTFVVRLWRPHGEGSATAFMNRADIIRKISATTGIRVVTAYGCGLVNTFRIGLDNKSIIYGIQLAFGIAYMHEDNISAETSIVMPAADYLMGRMSKTHKLREIGEQYLGHVNRIPIVQSKKHGSS